MLLDTGTDPSVIDASLAQRLRAISDATVHQGTGIGVEKVTASEWDMVDLRLGHLRADTVSAAALDLGRISDKLGTHLDGVLGYSFLAGRIVQIDYRRHRVRFYEDTPSWGGSESVDFAMALDPGDPTPRFTGRINRRDVVLLLDTGSSHSVSVVGGSIPTLGLKAAFEAAAPDSAAGDGGHAQTRSGRVPSVEIGQIRFMDVPCVFGVQGYGESWDPRVPAGKIGGALVEGMVVTLDYPHRRIRFER
jgi:predicted aspartyl protease